jgi:hypothetical protein
VFGHAGFFCFWWQKNKEPFKDTRPKQMDEVDRAGITAFQEQSSGDLAGRLIRVVVSPFCESALLLMEGEKLMPNFQVVP